MTGSAARLKRLRDAVEVPWSEQEQRLIHGRIERAVGIRRGMLKLVFALGLPGLVIAGGTLARWHESSRAASHPAPPSQARAETESPFGGARFSDGSKATFLTPGTRFLEGNDRAERVVSELVEGAARFEVVHRPERRFQVRVGDLTVEVLGTIFTVERKSSSLLVAVERGRVRVSWANGVRELVSAERAEFPLTATKAQTADVGPLACEGQAPAASLPAAAEPAATEPAAAEPTEAAGRVDSAPPSSTAGGTGPGPNELLKAADAARARDQPAVALTLLSRLVRAFPHDPRASLAAFLSGRVLRYELDRPTDAAHAFAQSRKLAPAGPLAEDALAREVEAWARAGDLDKARSSADLYLRLQPHGAHRRQVMRFARRQTAHQ